VLKDYLLLIVDKLIGHILPVRFVLFAGVGAVGIAAHLVVLRLCLALEMAFPAAQAVATGVAILGNFLLNNIFTFSDRRLKGARFVWGLLTFAAISAVGAVLNINISSVLFGPAHWSWYFAGFAGAAMSLVWNYAVSSAVTWRR
jgi:dolichol-phosphate mannosyltransferase